MGQGLFTTEKPIYDTKTGQKISNSTWVRNILHFYIFILIKF